MTKQNIKTFNTLKSYKCEYSDDKLVAYMNKGVNSNGVTFAQLVIKFVIKEQLCSEVALNRRINKLIKEEIIERCQHNSPVFYKIKQGGERKNERK